jgi:prevent-host-death family protein
LEVSLGYRATTALSWCYHIDMRSVTALDVRRRFGQIVDEAAAGERIVIERAGQPVAAIVPLSDLALVDPDRRKAERLAAIDEIARYAKRLKVAPDFDAATAIRRQRLEREGTIGERIRRTTR